MKDENIQIQALADSLRDILGNGTATITKGRNGRVAGIFHGQQGETQFEMLIMRDARGTLSVYFAVVGYWTYAIIEGKWQRL
jgi:hypothetical protein